MMATVVLVGLMAGSTAAQPRKPNIVVIWGDDVDIAYVFNVRQDPYESYEQAPGPRATITQQKTWLYNDVMDRLGQHMTTLRK